MGDYTYNECLALYGVGGAHPGGLGLTKELLHGERIDQNSRILDAGCGTGQTAAYIAKTYGCHVTALDRHPIMVEKARKRFKNMNIADIKIDLIQGDVEKIPLADGLFDLILVESVTVFTDIEKALSEYVRVLSADGILIDLEMTAASPFLAAELEEFKKLYEIKGIPTKKEWCELFLKAGFESVEIVREKSVAQELEELKMTSGETQEFDISYPIDPFLYQILTDHQILTEKYSNRLDYTVYRGSK